MIRWILFGVGIGWVVWVLWPEKIIVPPSQSNLAVKKVQVHSLPPQRLLRASTKISIREQDTKDDPGCVGLWKSLTLLDLNQFAKPVVDESLGFIEVDEPERLIELALRAVEDNPCQKPTEKHSIRSQHHYFLDECQKAKAFMAEANVSTDKKMNHVSDCLAGLLEYRRAITAYLTRETPLEEISDLPTLAHKLYEQTLNLDNSPDEVAKVATRILSLDPENVDVIAHTAKVYLMDAKTELNAREVSLSQASDWVERLGRIDPSSEIFLELRLALDLIGKDVSSLGKHAGGAIEESRHPGIAYYYLAWERHQSKDSEGAIEFLKKAQAFEATKKRAIEALSALNENDRALDRPIFQDHVSEVSMGGFSLNREYFSK